MQSISKRITCNTKDYFSNFDFFFFTARRDNKGFFIVLRRPSDKESKHTDFLPCVHCFGYVLSQGLSNHEKKCEYVDGTRLGQPTMKRMARNKIMEDVGGYSKEMRKLLSSLQGDNVGTVCREDPTIMSAAQNLLNFHNKKDEAIPQVRQEIRILARLLMEMRKSPGNQKRDLKSFIKPSEWPFFLTTIKSMCFEDEKFTLARNMGYIVSNNSFLEPVCCEKQQKKSS